MNKTKGKRPVGGGPFALSVVARTTIRRTAVPKNSEKKQATEKRTGRANQHTYVVDNAGQTIGHVIQCIRSK